jgi:L-fucose dehydrogenase
MELHLKDKVIIVTGGAKGIGEAITRSLAREGAIPVIAGRSGEEGELLVKELEESGCKAYNITVELHEAGNCDKVIKGAYSRFGKIDGLINNAGVNDGVGLQSGSPDKFMASLQLNLSHYYNLAHFALPYLKETKGSIINISSKTALTGQGNTSAYAAAKGAQLALTREWATELLPFGIRVNAIIPAEVMTPLYESWLKTFQDPKSKLDQIVSKIPFEKRMTTSEEIADMAVFLLSGRSGHTTGQQIIVDGGYVHLDRALT